jgi:hypothetical protein
MIYLPTLQTHVNGSPESYAEDVAEIQTALNLGGTLHATGYPLYAMIGAVFVSGLRGLGVNPALAASLYSLVWGGVALSIFYALIVKLTGRTSVAAIITGLLGLTRGVWAYSVVAKPYTMTLAFCAFLLLLALWPGVESRRRVLLLALVGGFAVAHHRMIAFMAPGLLVAALPPLFRDRRRIIPTLALAIPVSLIGFLTYLYLPIRAWAGALYVYGNPTTLQGFLDEFTAKEASHLFKIPTTSVEWLADAQATFSILFSQMTPFGAILGLIALVISVIRRRIARTAALCGVGFLVFLFVLHRVVMPTAVMTPVVLILMFLIALLLNDLLTGYAEAKVWSIALPTFTIAGIVGLLAANFNPIYQITHDQRGLTMIEAVRKLPRDGVLMFPWSTMYNAVAFSKYVTGENADLAIMDHRGDLRGVAGSGKPIYTHRDTLYRFPLAWWDERLGRAYLSSPQEAFLAIRATPTLTDSTGVETGVGFIHLQGYQLVCDREAAHLSIQWSLAATAPTDRPNLSVFVHLLSESPETVLANGDQSAPLYGWYPVSRWSLGELITDRYSVSLKRGATLLRAGLYTRNERGEFVNYPVLTLNLREEKCGLP